jgi:hypothetical protein
MTITLAQNKQLHTLLSLTRQMPYKADLVAAFTNGRTTSSKELHQLEALELINHLQQIARKAQTDTDNAANRMRRKLIAMAREIHWEEYYCPPKSVKPTARRADMNRINNWCRQYGYLHKALNDYSYKELPALLSQFEKGPYLASLKTK